MLHLRAGWYEQTLALQQRNEMPQQPTYSQSIQPGGHVVEDDTPAFRQAFKLSGRKRFRNVKEPEEDESQKSVPPIGTAAQQGDPLARHFVNDHEAGVVPSALARSKSRRWYAQRNRNNHAGEQSHQQTLWRRMEAPGIRGPKQH